MYYRANKEAWMEEIKNDFLVVYSMEEIALT